MLPWVQTRFDVIYTPALDDGPEYRLNSQVDYRILIHQFSSYAPGQGALNLTFSVIHEYDSVAENNNNDLKYVSSLSYDF